MLGSMVRMGLLDEGDVEDDGDNVGDDDDAEAHGGSDEDDDDDDDEDDHPRRC